MCTVYSCASQLRQVAGTNMETQARLLAGERLWAVTHLLCNHVCLPVFNR